MSSLNRSDSVWSADPEVSTYSVIPCRWPMTHSIKTDCSITMMQYIVSNSADLAKAITGVNTSGVVIHVVALLLFGYRLYDILALIEDAYFEGMASNNDEDSVVDELSLSQKLNLLMQHKYGPTTVALTLYSIASIIYFADLLALNAVIDLFVWTVADSIRKTLLLYVLLIRFQKWVHILDIYRNVTFLTSVRNIFLRVAPPLLVIITPVLAGYEVIHVPTKSKYGVINAQVVAAKYAILCIVCTTVEFMFISVGTSTFKLLGGFKTLRNATNEQSEVRRKLSLSQKSSGGIFSPGGSSAVVNAVNTNGQRRRSSSFSSRARLIRKLFYALITLSIVIAPISMYCFYMSYAAAPKEYMWHSGSASEVYYLFGDCGLQLVAFLIVAFISPGYESVIVDSEAVKPPPRAVTPPRPVVMENTKPYVMKRIEVKPRSKSEGAAVKRQQIVNA